MIKTVLIGAGNLAFHFQKNLIASKKTELIQWYSRKLDKINFIKGRVAVTDQISDLKTADLYLITIADDAIAEISAKIQTSALVVHCSGAVPMNKLLCNAKKGVFYPLQTFSKEYPVNFNKVNVLIETEQENDLELLINFANALGAKPVKMDSQKRAYIHLIAVIINNFGNHLLSLGEEIANQQNIPFELFNPLIEQTYKKAISIGSKNSQTGPAKRNDEKTIKNHVDLIRDDDIKKLYLNLTKSIRNKHE